jgi:hypothetical protein
MLAPPMNRVACCLLCLARIPSDCRNQKIDTEWSVLIIQEAFELGYLFSKHVWGIANLLFCKGDAYWDWIELDSRLQ